MVNEQDPPPASLETKVNPGTSTAKDPVQFGDVRGKAEIG